MFIEHITVHKEKTETSYVDEREHARYSSTIHIEEIKAQYPLMTSTCKNAIDECEAIVYSNRKFIVPQELLK